MNKLLILPMLIPLLAGCILYLVRFPTRRARNCFTLCSVITVSLISVFIIRSRGVPLNLMTIGENMPLVLGCDGLGAVFLGLIAFLWPLSTLYAFEYMEKEENTDRFFAFYTVSYGVTAGVALSGNLITMYLFYELLTLVTIPLVSHNEDRCGMRAGRKYIIYSLGGAALSFAGIIIIITSGQHTLFVPGGLGAGSGENTPLLILGYLFTFFGFGVKAAVFPLHAWLPEAGVAPTPVTALLHAVAVVKSGVFAIIRSTFYAFGTELLAGTGAQQLVLLAASVTIVYGSAMALKEQHLKRRLAYSTISNLSYILLGAALMTSGGLTAALSHMLFHGIMKIALFLCAGAVICKTGKEYTPQLTGLGRKMPFTFITFSIASLALTGAPLLPGFISKMNLLNEAAAAASENIFALLGMAALLVSALLTAAYLIPLCIRAFLPVSGAEPGISETDRDPGLRMLIPFLILCAAMIYFGLRSGPLMETLSSLVNEPGLCSGSVPAPAGF